MIEFIVGAVVGSIVTAYVISDFQIEIVSRLIIIAVIGIVAGLLTKRYGDDVVTWFTDWIGR